MSVKDIVDIVERQENGHKVVLKSATKGDKLADDAIEKDCGPFADEPTY